MLGKLLRRLQPRGGCGLQWLVSPRRAAALGRGQGVPQPGTDAAGGGQPVSAGACGAGKLRSRAWPGTVWARGLHCCFCINMAVSGAHGGPGREGGGRAGRPPLVACPPGAAAAANMAGAVLGPAEGRIGGRGGRRGSGTGSGLGPGARGPGLVAWRARGSTAGPGAAKRHGCMGAFVIPRSAPRAGSGGGPARGPRSSSPPGAPGGAGWEPASGRRRQRRGPDRFVRCRRRRRRRLRWPCGSAILASRAQAQRAPPSPRLLPARLCAPGAQLPPPPPAPRVP